jgi:hypothetical protein
MLKIGNWFAGLYKKINGYQASWALGAAFNLLEK